MIPKAQSYILALKIKIWNTKAKTTVQIVENIGTKHIYTNIALGESNPRKKLK